MYCVKPGIPGFLCARVHLFHSRSSNVNAAERRPKNRKCLTKREIIAYQPESVGEEEEMEKTGKRVLVTSNGDHVSQGIAFHLAKQGCRSSQPTLNTHTHTHSFILINLIDFHRSIQLN